MKLIKEPIQTEREPSEEAIARSLSPNQFDATLLGRFIKNGWPVAAIIEPI